MVIFSFLLFLSTPVVLSTSTNRFHYRDNVNKKIEAWRKVDEVKKSNQKHLTNFELEFWKKVLDLVRPSDLPSSSGSFASLQQLLPSAAPRNQDSVHHPVY
jgi:hypothetical protein